MRTNEIVHIIVKEKPARDEVVAVDKADEIVAVAATGKAEQVREMPV